MTQFVMVVALGLMYPRRAERVFDPLAEKAIARHTRVAEATDGDGRGRFARTPEGEPVGSRSATASREPIR